MIFISSDNYYWGEDNKEHLYIDWYTDEEYRNGFVAKLHFAIDGNVIPSSDVTDVKIDADATGKGFYAERNDDGDWMLKFRNEDGSDSGDITLTVTAKDAEGKEITSPHTVNVVLEHRIHLWGVYGDEDNFTINKYPGSGTRYIAFHHDDNSDIGKCDVNLEVLDNTGIDIKAEYEDSGTDEEGQKYSSYKIVYSGAGNLTVGDEVKLKLTVTSNGITTVYDDIVMPVVKGYDMDTIVGSATMKGNGIAFSDYPWFLTAHPKSMPYVSIGITTAAWSCQRDSQFGPLVCAAHS